MLNVTKPQTPPPALGDVADSLGGHLQLLIDEAAVWLSGHSLQILIGTALGAVIVVLLLGVRSLGVRLCGSADAHAGGHWRVVIGRTLAKTRTLFMVALAAELVAGYAQAPDAVARTIHFLFVIAAVMQGALWVRELILGFVEHRAGGDDQGSLGSALGIIRLLVTVVVFALALVLVLDNLGVNVTGLVAGLGIGGIAIGLAAQGIFSDLFAALAILFDKPFRRGDQIKWDQTSGTVEAIGLKTTRVRALTGEEVVISNANLLGKELHNMARLDHRRVTLTFGVIYQTAPAVCAQIPAMLERIVTACETCTLVRCGMVGFGASSLDYELHFDVHSQSLREVADRKSDIAIAILTAFNADGIEFAYPTQTTMTAAPDGTYVMPYAVPAS